MPYYQFSAIDPSGRQREGQIQAQSANEALQALMSQGLRSPRILAEGPAGQSAAVRRTQAPQQVIQQTPARPAVGLQAASQPAPGKIQINVPAAPAAPQIHYTKKSSEKDLYFLFSQIAEQLRAGVGPMQLFSELSQMYKDPKFRDSLGMIAIAASEGRPISNVMELWPDLYPEHVVGLIRAGEAGGFLPDAAATASEQAFNAHKFKRFHVWWVWILAINLLSIPIVFMFRQSVVSYMNEQEQRPTPGDMFAVFKVMGHFLVWPWGPVMILLTGLSLLLRHYLSSRPMKRFRHQVALNTPVLGRRARDESSTIFSWVLSRLARSGIPPNRAWEMAMNSVPNLGMRDKLQTAGGIMNEGSKLSDVIFKSNLFPQEYAPMVATGEMTGDIPGSLEKLSMVSRAEYDTGTVKSKAFTSTLGCTALIITTGIVTIVIAWVLERDITGHFMDQANGVETPTTTTTTPGNGSVTGNSSSDDLANPEK